MDSEVDEAAAVSRRNAELRKIASDAAGLPETIRPVFKGDTVAERVAMALLAALDWSSHA